MSQVVRDTVEISSSATPAKAAAVLNHQYPSSWWMIGFSEEVPRGMVMPHKVLERDVILWRDSEGTLHCQSAICPHLGAHLGYGGEIIDDTVKCPFHGFRFDANGACSWRPQERKKAPARVCLDNYIVEERYGTIFLWNGLPTPDHEIPDVVGELIEVHPELGPDDFTAYHHAFYLPYPAKWFTENTVDANHFAFVHGYAEWGDCPIVEETPTKIRYQPTLHNIRPYLNVGRMRELARRGELTLLVSNSSDLDITTYGGGIHSFQLQPGRADSSGMLGKVFEFIDSARGLVSFVPVTENTHVFRFTVLLPTIRVPVVGPLLEKVISGMVTRRDWGGALQDSAIMPYRQEPADPAYIRLDRGLVRFRRFWDSRLLDRSLWAGDLVHSNGRRAGIRWSDAPKSDESVSTAADDGGLVESDDDGFPAVANVQGRT